MDIPPATASSSLRRLGPWLVVLSVLLFVGFIRFRILEMPLERDEGEYAYVGQLILQGIPPYQLAYNMKFPGTYAAYAAGMAVFGQTIEGIHLTLIVANSLTIVFVFLLGRKLFGVTAGLTACAAYGIMSVSPTVFGMAAHANHFVVLFALPATWLLLKAYESDRRWLLFFSGLLFGLAVLMKQQGVFFGLFAAASLAARALKTGPAIFLKQFAAFTAGAILPFGLVCLSLAMAGVFRPFWFWTFTYARSYVEIASWSLGLQLLALHWKLGIPSSAGFWMLAVAGLWLGLRDRNLRKETFFAAFLWLFAFFGTATGLYFREQYFILVLPAFALLAGLGVHGLQNLLAPRLKSATAKTVPLVLFAAVMAGSIFSQKAYFFSLSGLQLSRTIYRNFPFVESLVIADHIRDHSAPGDRIAVLGSEPEIYFYAHRHSATGYLYTYPLVEPQPYASQMQRDMIREIESNQPAWLVRVNFDNSWLVYPANPDTTIVRWAGDYTGKFYERVGVAKTSADGKTTFLWDNEAKHYQSAGEQYIEVYQRKTPGTNAP